MADQQQIKRDELYRMIRRALHDEYVQCSNLVVLIDVRYPDANTDAESKLMQMIINTFETSGANGL